MVQLRLTLANSVPRHTVLIGKFLGALVSISVPFTLAILMNLLVISTSSEVQLGTDAWNRLGIVFLYCDAVSGSVSCVRFVGVVACAAECSESGDTSIDVGYLRGFSAEHACLHCKWIFNTDDLWSIRPTRQTTCK